MRRRLIGTKITHTRRKEECRIDKSRGTCREQWMFQQIGTFDARILLILKTEEVHC